MPEKIEDAVQPKAWYDALPRPQYKELKKVLADDWFEVYELPNQVYAIYEPRHFQEVISFLVLGSQKAMLVDTGMGFKKIKPIVDQLTKLPVFVVNTHSHFDHIGGNWEFTEGYILDTEPSRFRMTNGLMEKDVIKHLVEDSVWGDYPEGFDPDNYYIKPVPYWNYIQSGHCFDLGGRQIEILATPGHSPDSIMLVDKDNQILFTGDTVYPATMYAHLSSDDGMLSEQGVYRRTMHQVADAFSTYQIYCSHNEPLRDGAMLTAIADAFDAIENGLTPDAVDEKGLNKYQFDGFAITTL